MSKQKIEKLEKLIADKSISADEKKIYKEALDKLVKESVSAKRSVRKQPAIAKSMLKAIENEISAGDLSVGTGLSDYKDIEKLRSKMLSQLRKSDMEYSLENLRKLAKKHATSIIKERSKNSTTESESEKELLTQLAEMKGYKKQLEEKKIAPSKIIGTGFKNPRKSAFDYLDDQIDKLETKILALKEEQKVRSSKTEEDFDCDELIEEEKKRVADRRKRYEENKSKRESTKNVERTNKLTDTLDKSIKKRLESGKDVSKSEIEKLIDEVEQILDMLKKALTKAK